MVTTFVWSVCDRTQGIWKFMETVCQTDTGVRSVELQHPSLNQMLNNCTGRVPVYVPPSLYRSLKEQFPLDVGRLSWDGRVNTELGTGSLRQAIGIWGFPTHCRHWVGKCASMALSVASLNARGLRDASKCAHLLAELSNLWVDVAAVQKTQFTCKADWRVLEDDFVIFSAFGSHLSAGVSLLVGCSLDAIVNLVFAGDGGRLLVADVAVKTFKFRIAAVHTPSTAAERRLFFRRLGSFLNALKWTVLVGD